MNWFRPECQEHWSPSNRGFLVVNEPNYDVDVQESFALLEKVATCSEASRHRVEGSVIMTGDEGVAVQAGWGPTRPSVLLTALSLLIDPSY
jgi:hypothetical protein